jgi:hypothetical protein
MRAEIEARASKHADLICSPFPPCSSSNILKKRGTNILFKMSWKIKKYTEIK